MKKDIIKCIFYGGLAESERGTKEFQDTEEFRKRNEAYDKMEATFSEEQRKLFEEYYFWDGGCFNLQIERAYANGLKTGVWLAAELADFQPECRE